MSSEQAEDYILSFSSLLDRDRTESTMFEQYSIEAVPFKEVYCSGDVSLTVEDMEEPTTDSLSLSKIYFVNTLDTSTDTTDLMVVTMIPDLSYLSNHEVSEITYLDKADYSGMILYADIDGTYREACYFRRGRIFPARPVDEGTPVGEDETVHYLTTYQRVGTKATNGDGLLKKLKIIMLGGGDSYYGGELDNATCVAVEKTSPETVSQNTYVNGGELDNATCVAVEKTSPETVSQNTYVNGSVTYKGGRSSGTSSGKNGKAVSEKQSYKVVLYAEKYGSGEDEYCGVVSGSGTYANGSFVQCQAKPNSKYNFERWSGNMPGTGQSVSFCIHGHITATALFIEIGNEQQGRPCWSAKTNIANPLNSMIIAPTDRGSLDNGVFSQNNPLRNFGHHDGIDLSAEVGTPIFAPCDGTISKKYPFVTCQPQRNNEYWPAGYSGNKNNAGNRFYLECLTETGDRIYFAFFHLQAGTPVAKNPRTGDTFKKGDKVYQGEVIAYVGRTGNAYNIKNTHLHLGVKDSSGKWVDPEPYLNGDVMRENGEVSDKYFKNIRCDEIVSWLWNSNDVDKSGKNR